MSNTRENTSRSHLDTIYRAALQRVNPEAMIRSCLQLSGQVLQLRTETHEERVDLSAYPRIIVLGFGKASAGMAKAVEDLLGDRVIGGVVAVKYGHTEHLSRVELLEAGHPVPDEASIRAGKAILSWAERADADTLVITLISGGGSAILSAPAGEITLGEQQEVTQLLLASGATIGEMNTLRKHTSRVKGGRLAAAIAPARSLNLILSDVVGDPLEVIASGPTVPDPTTVADALATVERYGLGDRLPSSLRSYLDTGVETPKPGDVAFSRASNIIIGSNYLGLLAAKEAAQELGYDSAVVTSRLEGEARELSRLVLGIARDSRNLGLLVDPPGCILFGGETTVTIRGEGAGGRNQEMALAALASMTERDAGIYLLFAASDGNDGPTDAAGGYASWELAQTARERNLDLSHFLDANDSYRVLDTLGAHVKTGPTNTNVADFVVALVTST
jgi:glycerate 2-kinase